MSENPTSDEIGEDSASDEKLERDAEQAAGQADALDQGGYGGPGPESETGEGEGGSSRDGS